MKQLLRQIQEKLLPIEAFCHCPAVGWQLAVVRAAEQGMGQMPSTLMWGTATVAEAATCPGSVGTLLKTLGVGCGVAM